MKRNSILSAFTNAFNGLGYFFKHERNGKIQAGAAIVVVALGALLHISAQQWLAVLLCIGAVLSLEMVNSALEKLCDLVQPNLHPAIKIIKDVSAGAVLFFAIISVAVAAIIFLPKIFNL
jgi:diacylglycerol kinase